MAEPEDLSEPQFAKPITTNQRSPKRNKHGFTCPPLYIITKVITLIFIGILLWTSLWSVIGDDALPGGNLFALFMLVVIGEIAGFIVEAIHLPGLLGKFSIASKFSEEVTWSSMWYFL